MAELGLLTFVDFLNKTEHERHHLAESLLIPVRRDPEESPTTITLTTGDAVPLGSLPVATVVLAEPVGAVQVIDATHLSLCSRDALMILVTTPSAGGVLIRQMRGPTETHVVIPSDGDVVFSSCAVQIGDVSVPPGEPVYMINMDGSYMYGHYPETKLDTDSDYVDVLYLPMRARSQIASLPILTNYGFHSKHRLQALPVPSCACEWCTKTGTASTFHMLYIPLIDTVVCVLDCRSCSVEEGDTKVCEFSLIHLWAAGAYEGAGTRGLLGPDAVRPTGLMVSPQAVEQYEFGTSMLFSDAHEWTLCRLSFFSSEHQMGRTVAPWEPVFVDGVFPIVDDPAVVAVILDPRTSEAIWLARKYVTEPTTHQPVVMY